ncbi:Gfo/Idh/MocA family oxidoreductase [Sulfurovum sp. bin170]|uniref:Gfo/Idh/MocA family protein n=1 Tax=Sulfurovum sp. bin170 TaxID=2695268 RepID=UPI0013DECBD2|nr:Gfo/Idh/MocA family oxidoreductase [Sulfurovum sp. bin170]NEW60726.1 Gfo/Idh/MocA family oxidoreductase [Sulfurovum sp. bin170]
MVNIGLIGFGYWGPNVAKNIFNNGKYNLDTICDYDETRIEKAKRVYIEQVKYESDYRVLLADESITAVAIAVETSGHYKIAKDALLAGKHIYIEKPFTSTVEEAEELKDLALELGLIIHVDHIMIFHPVVQKIKSMIDSGELGDILYIDCKRLNLGQIKKDVSAMWDLAVHDLSIIDYLSGGKEPFYISAIGEKIYNPKETLVFLSLKYEGFIAHIQSSWISPLKERKIVIAGTKKMVVFDDMKADKLMIYDKGVNVIYDENIEYSDYSVKIRNGDLIIPYIPAEDALYNSLNHFLESILENRQSVSSPDQAIRLLNTLYRADNRMNK